MQTLKKNIEEYSTDQVEKIGVFLSQKYNFIHHNVVWDFDGRNVHIIGDIHNLSDSDKEKAINELVIALDH